jgi:hypothetical protein
LEEEAATELMLASRSGALKNGHAYVHDTAHQENGDEGQRDQRGAQYYCNPFPRVCHSPGVYTNLATSRQ